MNGSLCLGLPVLVSSFVTFVVVGGQQDTGQRFRTEASLVRVDIYPITEDGQAVTDLTADDFEVREDNTPQSIATFEHVVVPQASVTDARPEPTSLTASRALASGERARILVVFLDTFHTDARSARAIHQPLVRLLDGALGPDDVIAFMTPEMSVRDLTFSRKASGVERALARFHEWARRDMDRMRDPDEDRYETLLSRTRRGGVPRPHRSAGQPDRSGGCAVQRRGARDGGAAPRAAGPGRSHRPDADPGGAQRGTQGRAHRVERVAPSQGEPQAGSPRPVRFSSRCRDRRHDSGGPDHHEQGVDGRRRGSDDLRSRSATAVAVGLAVRIQADARRRQPRQRELLSDRRARACRAGQPGRHAHAIALGGHGPCRRTGRVPADARREHRRPGRREHQRPGGRRRPPPERPDARTT